MSKKVRSYLLGVLAEILISSFLTIVGWKVLHRRYRDSRCGEIDIIAICGDRLSFMEVKSSSRLKFFDFPLSYRQCKSILSAASSFISDNPVYEGYLVGFDLFLISASEVVYIADAWDASVLEYNI